MDYRAALISVLEDLEAASVPPELREAAFTRGLEAKLGGAMTAPPQPPTALTPVVGAKIRDSTEVDLPDASPYAAVAARLGVSVEDGTEVFSFGEAGAELVVGSGKLPSQAASAAKEIAVLVAAARQSNGEEWTPFSAIRAVCEAYGRLDSTNFATTMKELEDVFSFRSPSRQKREVKLNRPGWERATALVNRLVGG